MTITSGVGGRLFVDEHNISGSTATMRRLMMDLGVQNTTTIQDEATRRTPTIRHGAIDVTALWDTDAGQAEPVLRTLPNADRALSYHHRATRGAPAWFMIGKQITYSPNVANTKDLTIDVQAVANNYGLELGRSLTAGEETIGAAGGLTGVDDLQAVGSTDFGLQAILHVTAFTGTSVDIAIQDSDDDGSGDPYADVTGATFTTVSAVGSERIATGATENVKRWLRAELSGTFTSVTFAVAVNRNPVAVVF